MGTSIKPTTTYAPVPTHTQVSADKTQTQTQSQSQCETKKGTGLWYFIANLVLFVALLGVNGVLGKDIGEISLEWPTYLTPAPWAFAIWGLIYLLVLVFIVAEALPQFRDLPVFTHSIGPLFVIGSVMNMLWVILFTRNTPFFIAVSGIPIVGLFVCNFAMYVRSDNWIVAYESLWLTIGVKWMLSIYTAWSTCAMFLGISLALDALNLMPHEPAQAQQLALVMLIVLTAIVMAVGLWHRDPAFGGVFVWASVGIYVAKETSAPLVSQAARLAACIVAVEIACVLALRVKVWVTERKNSS